MSVKMSPSQQSRQQERQTILSLTQPVRLPSVAERFRHGHCDERVGGKLSKVTQKNLSCRVEHNPSAVSGGDTLIGWLLLKQVDIAAHILSGGVTTLRHRFTPSERFLRRV